MNTTKEKINEQVKEWVNKHLPNFSFRQYQLEYIVETIWNIRNNKHINIIEAPTGSGKSVIIMIMAGVLDEYYNMTSYILCSDLYLWQQYADFIEANKLPFGKVKGKRGNYTCDLSNGGEIELALCQLASYTYNQLFDNSWCANHGMMCALSCEFIQERKKAVNAHVTLMTYQLYFKYMRHDSKQFTPRNVVFCDECHNIPSLCQTFSALSFNEHYHLDMFKKIFDGAESYGSLDDDLARIVNNSDAHIDTLKDLYKTLHTCNPENKNKLQDTLSNLRSYINKYVNPCKNSIVNALAKPGKKLYKKEKAVLNACRDTEDLYENLAQYLSYSEQYPQYIVKNQVNDYIDEFKFAKEDMVVYNTLLKHQDFNVLLSATVGDQAAFNDNCGIKFTRDHESSMYVIPSTFDFSKSPIYFVNRHKMSQAYIAQSFPANAEIINKILSSDKHMQDKGIIHTGSYKNAAELFNLLTPDVQKRAYVYSNSKEKQDILEEFKNSKNGVLIGPTLTEGIDLPGDLCRFIIIMKVPYPYLGDNLVKAKMSLFPRWYNSETSNTIIQGIGRGNRTPEDWCTTYILDASWYQLYENTWPQYPPEMRNRIKLIN